MKISREEFIRRISRGLCTTCQQPVAPSGTNLNGTCSACVSRTFIRAEVEAIAQYIPSRRGQ